MLSQLSTSHVTQLLKCLQNSYKLACEFDVRPGLKFLVQKVARTPVAVNLYKQAGASMVFYIHTLIKICANMPELTKESVQSFLSKETRRNVETENEVNSEKEATADHSVQEDAIADRCDVKYTGENNKTDNTKSSSLGMPVVQEDDNSCKAEDNDKGNFDCDSEEREGAKLINNATTAENTPESLSQILTENPRMFVSQLKVVCDELCQTYIDIICDSAGTNCVDTMSDQQLFFLIAQPDEFPELPVKHKVDAKQLSKKLEQTQARLQGHGLTVPVHAVGIQGKNRYFYLIFFPLHELSSRKCSDKYLFVSV